MTRLQNVNRRVLAVVLAVVFVLSVVPMTVFVVKAESDIRYTDSHVVDLDGLYTNKTVSKIDDNTYNVKLEAYAKESTIQQPLTDIVMSMDLSKRMGVKLYDRKNWKNLNTHTIFSPVSLSKVTFNDLYDENHYHNEGSVRGFGTLTNTYNVRKYVEDPNTPGVYVYLAEAYKNIHTDGQHYQFDFTDSLGNDYTTGELNGLFLSYVGHLTFRLKDPSSATPDAKSTYKIEDFYTRPADDNSSLNTTLVRYAGTPVCSGPKYTPTDNRVAGFGDINYTRIETATYNNTNLYIMSDDGEEIRINVVVTRRASYKESYAAGRKKSTSDFSYENLTYTYSCSIDGQPYTVVQGNNEYGADYGVFQGFKVYTQDDSGNPVVDHSHSIESKSLYVKESQEVTRLQAMKEAAEHFIIQLHTDAFHKNPDLTKPNVRLSVITYGVDSTLLCELPDINLSNEVEVNKIIDRIYALTPSERYASQLNEAMAAAKSQFESYSRKGTNKAPDNDGGFENKKVSVLFSSGVPSSETYKGLLVKRVDATAEKQFNTTVANAAIKTANEMKRDLGVQSYTVGLYNGASIAADDKYGKLFSYGNHLIHNDKVCNGNVGEIWGSTKFSDLMSALKDGNVVETDIPATNRVMDYISSNFSDVSKVGLTWGTNWNPRRYLLTSGGSGYRIDANYNPTSDGHFFALDYEVPGAEETLDANMKGIFSEIASEIEIPSTTLNEEDQLIDYITEYFDVDKDTVLAYTQLPDTAASYESRIDDFKDNVIIDGNEIAVDGFNYSEHYLGSEKPLKIVLDFNIVRKAGFIGGNNIPTNTSLAAVYDIEKVKDENGDVVKTKQLLEEAFKIPHVDLSILMDNPTNNASVYYGSVQNLEELIDHDAFDGFRNRFVDITYEIYDGEEIINAYTVKAGESSGTWENAIKTDQEDGTNIQNLDKTYPQMTETKDYKIVCTVDPTVQPGTLGKTAIRAEDDTDPVSTVYVFTPHVDVHNDSLTEPGTYNLSTNPSVSETWECKDASGSALTDEELETAKSLLPEEIPDVELVIDRVDTTKPAVSSENVSVYQVDETMDFIVTEVHVTPLPFMFEATQPVTYTYEDNSTETIKEQITHYVNDGSTENNHHEWPSVVANLSNGKVSYKNTTDNRDNGAFTITVGKHFDMVISKVFAGDYVNPEEITIVVSPEGGETGSERTVTFTADSFTYGSTGYTAAAQTIAGLDANQIYIISERYADASRNVEAYDTSFLVKSGENGQLVVEDSDEESTNKQFKLVKSNDEYQVIVTVTNTMPDPVITGIAQSDSRINPFFIAAAIVALLGGSGTVYAVKRKEETE